MTFSTRNVITSVLLFLQLTVFGVFTVAGQCPCLSNDYGSLDASTLNLGLEVIVIGDIYSGERATIYNTVNGAVYRLSTCGATYDTQLTIYTNPNCSFLAYNDDFGPGCPQSNRASVDVTSPGGDLFVVLNQYNCISNSIGTTLYITLLSLPVNSSQLSDCGDIFFSEYVEGTGNNKAVEVVNPTPNPVNLNNYQFLRLNGGSTIVNTYVFNKIIPPGGVFVIANSQADPAILAVADTVSAFTSFNGDDALMIIRIADGDTLDIFGTWGIDPGTNWPIGGGVGSTLDYTLVRKQDVRKGQLDWNLGQMEWDVYPVNTFSNLGSHTMLPCLPAYYPIAQIRGYDSATCDHDSVGISCQVSGVVYGLNLRPQGLQFYIHDHTGGINVFRSTGNVGYSVQQGDSILVFGTLLQFNGLLEIVPDSIVLISTGNSLKTPIPVTYLDENLESEYVLFENVWMVNPASWTGTGSGFNVLFTNGTDTLEIRVDNDMPFYSQPAPTGPVNIQGIVTQFDQVAPFCEVYQILPLYIEPVSPPCPGVGGLYTNRLRPTAARLNWTPQPAAHHYKIRGKTVNSPVWTYLNVNNPATSLLEISGLATGVTYVWQIIAYCDASETLASAWSVTDTFVTGCYAPDSIWTSPILNTAARFNWLNRPGASGYAIQGRLGTSSSSVTLLVASPFVFKDVFGLNPGTEYQWRIRTWCDQNGNLKSDWTNWLPFTTTGPRLEASEAVNAFGEIPGLFAVLEPGGNHVLVEWEGQNSSARNLRFYDISGRMVWNGQVDENAQQIRVPVQHLSSGLYVVELTGDYPQRTRVQVIR